MAQRFYERILEVALLEEASQLVQIVQPGT
jgi:hypothetical protein